jgi:phytoene synthase
MPEENRLRRVGTRFVHRDRPLLRPRHSGHGELTYAERKRRHILKLPRPFKGEKSPLSLSASEQYCREMTRRAARNFYWGFVALPKDQRVAIYALYGFARQVDDDADLLVDSGLPHLLQASRFDYHRDRLRRCYAGDVSDPVMQVLAHVVSRYQIPREELEALIRGVERDLQVTRYESWAELKEYCRLVASTIGRMCVRVFGFSDPVALDLADDLGVAMQLVNILRDIREDLQMGRVYLPQEELRQFDVREEGLREGDPGEGWKPLVHYQIARAHQFFQSGLRVTELIPRRAAVCVLTMAGMYLAILEQLSRDPDLPLRERASLGKKDKLAVMLKSWLQAV